MFRRLGVWVLINDARDIAGWCPGIGKRCARLYSRRLWCRQLTSVKCALRCQDISLSKSVWSVQYKVRNIPAYIVVTSCFRLRLQLGVENILNHQPAELFIYGYSFKRAMKKTKRSWRKHPFLDRSICWNTTPKGRKSFRRTNVVDHLCLWGACRHSKNSTWRPNLASQRVIMNANPGWADITKNNSTFIFGRHRLQYPTSRRKLRQRIMGI